jgi:glutathione S-transferase
MQLYLIPGAYRGAALMVVANQAGISYTATYTMPHTEEVLKVNPLGLLPAMKSKDGFCLAETCAIVRYMAKSAPSAGLYGATVLESS